MRALRRTPAVRWLLLAAMIAATMLGHVANGLDAVRYRHVYCAEHEVVEHRSAKAPSQSAPEDDRDQGDHAPCASPGVVVAEPPQPPILVGLAFTIDPVGPPAPLTGGAAAQAPPLSYAPKTSPPALV